jgi:hypothetical protein
MGNSLHFPDNEGGDASLGEDIVERLPAPARDSQMGQLKPICVQFLLSGGNNAILQVFDKD